MKPIYTPSAEIQPEVTYSCPPSSFEPDFRGFSRQQVFPGIYLSVLNMPDEYFSADFGKIKNIVEFAFIINGNAMCSLDSSTLKPMELGSRSAVVNSFPGASGRFEVKSNCGIQMLGIDMEIDVLTKMLREEESPFSNTLRSLASGSSSYLLKNGQINAMQTLAIRQLLSCPCARFAKSLFIQSKVLELISLQVSLFADQVQSADSGFISADDEERIRFARDILKSRMTEPPNLIELSEMVGLSTGKLKRGFKTVFGKPAFRCLHEDRMERAHFLLAERRLNVSEVAWEVGYINVGHFSTAFHNHFGIRPKDFQLNCT